MASSVSSLKDLKVSVPKVKTPESTPPAYQGPDQGPFRCDHCEYYNNGVCRKPQVVDELGAVEGRLPRVAKVDAGGCCNFFKKG